MINKRIFTVRWGEKNVNLRTSEAFDLFLKFLIFETVVLEGDSFNMLVIRHLVFFTVAAPYGENSHCPDHKIMYHMSAHTRKHDVNIRDKRIRLRTTRKKPYARFDTPRRRFR